ncbi:hypothetical protein COCCADRAFT_21612 [Bipolaris zeicola 26-R-13]|uniref:Uncharacterized protein n=1 Tax=Cochliobolus carbonum (strain 26-R-13) TaxID=930089 RepID=W6YIR4_COCC2|nr:uncharacterized protein COCCADRAFT_21612 [Bipolaris zeicola 26-R-13]EUC39197.1 hypothetical protein COCCADRAFT_21612 [Bipolaris zeicola 26-R-13]
MPRHYQWARGRRSSSHATLRRRLFLRNDSVGMGKAKRTVPGFMRIFGVHLCSFMLKSVGQPPGFYAYVFPQNISASLCMSNQHMFTEQDNDDHEYIIHNHCYLKNVYTCLSAHKIFTSIPA